MQKRKEITLPLKIKVPYMIAFSRNPICQITYLFLLSFNYFHFLRISIKAFIHSSPKKKKIYIHKKKNADFYRTITYDLMNEMALFPSNDLCLIIIEKRSSGNL